MIAREELARELFIVSWGMASTRKEALRYWRMAQQGERDAWLRVADRALELLKGDASTGAEVAEVVRAAAELGAAQAEWDGLHDKDFDVIGTIGLPEWEKQMVACATRGMKANSRLCRAVDALLTKHPNWRER